MVLGNVVLFLNGRYQSVKLLNIGYINDKLNISYFQLML